MRGLAELGEGSLDATKFMRKAAGARGLSIKVQATQLRADGDEAGAEALEAVRDPSWVLAGPSWA